VNEIEKNLQRYLETETLLNTFFSVFDYCWSQCILIELRKNGNRPVTACCNNRYYSLYDLEHPAFNRLREEREKMYGKPDVQCWRDPVSPCEYHDPNRGCVLATHKSPICLSFLCREGIDVLRGTYGIYAYDYLGVNYALEWILTGDLSEREYLDFRTAMLDMTERVKRIRKGPGRALTEGQASDAGFRADPYLTA